MEPQHTKAVEEAGAIYDGEIGAFHIKRFWLTFQNLYRLRALLSRQKIELLHCHYLSVNTWYAALTQFRPLVITVMGGGDVCGPDWKPTSRRERVFTPYALRRAALVTCWSPVLARAVRPFCRPETPIEVIHGGIDLKRFRPSSRPTYLLGKWQLPPTAKIVFSPRLMRPLSNIAQIAEAIPYVCKEKQDTYFLFAAPGEERDEGYEAKVREMIAREGYASNVRFIGPIAHTEMADYHRLANIAVSIPSTDGTPMSVLESMACGTPVIVGDIPDYDLRYIEPGKTVLNVSLGNAESLAHAILQLLTNRSLANSLSAEARIRVEKSASYEAQMSRMEQLYEQLL